MRKVLHILTTPNDSLALEIISTQHRQPDHEVTVVDWTAEEPDCAALVRQIFSADSVEVW